jgi:hypothetical protein
VNENIARPIQCLRAHRASAFGIGSKIEDGSLSKSEAVEELFSKAGVSELARDWQSFLSQ